MTRPWQILDSVDTPDGVLELRRRGERDFLITLAGRVLMNASARRSEEALAQDACARLAGKPAPRVLIAGLGMGFTLRAALDQLPATARVAVVELHACVIAWCRGVLAPLTGGALGDARVEIAQGDVADSIRRAPAGALDAIVLDLYTGPAGAEPCFEPPLLAAALRALAPDGVYAIWSERPDPAFEKRLAAAGFEASCRRVGRGGLRHAIHLATPGRRAS